MFAIFLSMAVFVNGVEARRFGGGRSFGKSWSSPSRNSSSYFSKNSANKASSFSKGRRGSMLKGALMGLLAGGLIGSLLSGVAFHGLQGMDMLILAGIAFLVFRWFQNRKQQTQAYGQHNQSFQQPHQPEQGYQYTNTQQATFQGQNSSQQPSWFNEQKFVEGAKSHFIKLQKAWDNNDLVTIQSYCVPELYNSIAAERADYSGTQQTSVLNLNARLLDIVEEGNMVVAGIEFEATVQSNNEPSERIREVWSIQHEKAHGQGDWLIVGIEQR